MSSESLQGDFEILDCKYLEDQKKKTLSKKNSNKNFLLKKILYLLEI